VKILITGNMGYIGPNLVKRLRKTYPSAVIMGVDTGFFSSCLTGADILPECLIDVQHIVDIRDVEPELLNGVNAIIHLAAISNDPMGNTYEDVTRQINYNSSVKLARMAKQAGVEKFIFASSCSVYGCAEGGPRNEKATLNPLTAYAKSKVDTEKEIEYLASKEFLVTCLRFSTACGMSDRLRLDLVLNDFVAGAIASQEISILSDGTPWRPLIHVDDMALAMDWAVGRVFSNGGAFVAVNTGSDGWNYQVRDLAEAVARVIPNTRVSINKDAQSDKRSYQVDFALYRELAPQHQPRVDLDSAITGLRDGLLTMNFSDNNFRNSTLMRLKMIASYRENGMLNDELRWKFRARH